MKEEKKHNNSKDNNESNFYKYTTFVLISIIIIVGLLFLVNNAIDKKALSIANNPDNPQLQETFKEIRDNPNSTLMKEYNQKLYEEAYYSGVAFGQQNAVNIIVSTIAEEGSVEIPVEDSNQSVSLVSSQRLGIAQEDAVRYIIELVETEGSVLLSIDNKNITLVEYKQ